MSTGTAGVAGVAPVGGPMVPSLEAEQHAAWPSPGDAGLTAVTDVAHGPASSADPDERALITRLRDGDEAAFVQLVDRLGPSLRRIARLYATEAVADEVVQETWIAVLRGIDRFEGRASLRTWMTRILINIARHRGERERRQIPFSAFAEPNAGSEAAVSPDRFRAAGDRFPGGWVSFPERWDEHPEARFLSSEGVAVARRAIDALPDAQREVVTLRDVEGWSSDDVCDALGISQGNQRVLLHRGRSKVRAALEAAMADPVAVAEARR